MWRQWSPPLKPQWRHLCPAFSQGLCTGPVAGVGSLDDLWIIFGVLLPFPFLEKYSQCKIQDVWQPSFILSHFLCPLLLQLTVPLLIYSYRYLWSLLRWLIISWAILMISLSNDCSKTLSVLFRTSFLTFAICIGCDFFFFFTAPSSGSFLLNNYASIYFFLSHFTVGSQEWSSYSFNTLLRNLFC